MEAKVTAGENVEPIVQRSASPLTSRREVHESWIKDNKHFSKKDKDLCRLTKKMGDLGEMTAEFSGILKGITCWS